MDKLLGAGIDAVYFTGYFAREISKSGCQIFVSCQNEEHIDKVKPKLRQFLDNQTIDNNDPSWDNIA